MFAASSLATQVVTALKAKTCDAAYHGWLSVTQSAFNLVQPLLKSSMGTVVFSDIREDFEAAFRAIADRRGWIV